MCKIRSRPIHGRSTSKRMNCHDSKNPFYTPGWISTNLKICIFPNIYYLNVSKWKALPSLRLSECRLSVIYVINFAALKSIKLFLLSGSFFMLTHEYATNLRLLRLSFTIICNNATPVLIMSPSNCDQYRLTSPTTIFVISYNVCLIVLRFMILQIFNRHHGFKLF